MKSIHTLKNLLNLLRTLWISALQAGLKFHDGHKAISAKQGLTRFDEVKLPSLDYSIETPYIIRAKFNIMNLNNTSWLRFLVSSVGSLSRQGTGVSERRFVCSYKTQRNKPKDMNFRKRLCGTVYLFAWH